MLQKIKEILFIPPDVALLSALIGSNYPDFEHIFMVPKVFEPLKFYCISNEVRQTRVPAFNFFSAKPEKFEIFKGDGQDSAGNEQTSPNKNRKLYYTLKVKRKTKAGTTIIRSHIPQ